MNQEIVTKKTDENDKCFSYYIKNKLKSIYFCYLNINFKPNHKTNTQIKVSSYPFERTVLRNERRSRGSVTSKRRKEKIMDTIDTMLEMAKCTSFNHPDTQIEQQQQQQQQQQDSNKKKRHLNWKYEAVIGPFYSEKCAQQFKFDWRKGSRGILRRKVYGLLLSRYYNKNPELRGSQNKLTCWANKD